MQTKKKTKEMFSKTGILAISILLCFSSITLVKADKAILADLTNAVQHITEIRLIDKIYTWSTLKKDKLSLNIKTNNFIITQSWNNNQINNSEGVSIIWWNNNKISSSKYSTILGWTWNHLVADYATIWWGKSNIIQAWSTWATIIWWEYNKITRNSTYSTIIWWKDNTISWTDSTIAWNNNTLTGNYSVILGSWVNLNWNNSFVWSDWTEKRIINQNNTFFILWKSWMAINSESAHAYTKLTIWGSLIISANDENDNNISCGNWKWAWIIKFTWDSRWCFCVCNGSGRNSLLWDGTCEATCRWEYNWLNPQCWESVTINKDNQNKSYYIWTCKNWFPITGSYFVDSRNIIHRTCQTIDWNTTTSCSRQGKNGTVTPKSYSCWWIKPTPDTAYRFSTKSQNEDKSWHYDESLSEACTFTCAEWYERDSSNNECKKADPNQSCNPADKNSCEWNDVKWTYNTSNCSCICPDHSTLDKESKKCVCNPGYKTEKGACIPDEDIPSTNDSCTWNLPSKHYETSSISSESSNEKRTYNENLDSACTFKCESWYNYINIKNDERDCVKCQKWTQKNNYCVLLKECGEWYKLDEEKNECIAEARCLYEQKGIKNFWYINETWDYIRPYENNKELTTNSCKDNHNEVTPNSCEFSCEEWSYCTRKGQPECKRPSCYLANWTKAISAGTPTYEQVNDNDYLYMYRTFVTGPQEWWEFADENEFRTRANANPWCRYRCEEQYQYKYLGTIYCYTEQEQKELDSQNKNYCKQTYHRWYDLEYENPTWPNIERTFVDYNTYQEYKNQRKEWCYRTCDTSISWVEQEPKTWVVSSKDFQVCRKPCNEDEYIASYGKCEKCSPWFIWDKDSIIEWNATKCKELCEEGSVRQTPNQCVKSISNGKCEDWWNETQDNKCVKCLNSDEIYNDNTKECEPSWSADLWW